MPDPKRPSMPREERHRPGVQLTLTRDAAEMLTTIADEDGTSRSAVVERLVRAEARRRKRRDTESE